MSFPQKFNKSSGYNKFKGKFLNPADPWVGLVERRGKTKVLQTITIAEVIDSTLKKGKPILMVHWQNGIISFFEGNIIRHNEVVKYLKRIFPYITKL